jgi:hypothetical protein
MAVTKIKWFSKDSIGQLQVNKNSSTFFSFTNDGFYTAFPEMTFMFITVPPPFYFTRR